MATVGENARELAMLCGMVIEVDGDSSLAMTITGVCVRPGGALYVEGAWVYDGQARSAWFNHDRCKVRP